MPPILLTTAEQELFAKLPPALREALSVAEETQTTYETDEELHIRMKMAKLDKNPKITELARSLEKGPPSAPMDASLLDDIAFPDLLFVIGARGTSLLINGLLRTAQDEEDMNILMTLSSARHELLEANAEIDYAPQKA